ncbi:unnamed protein product [Leuciscus chuanchicus]
MKQKHSPARKKAEARKTGGGPPPPSLTPAEELGCPLIKGDLWSMGFQRQFDDDEETTSAVTETENVGRPIENMAGDLNTDEGPSTSTQNLSSLPAKELYKVHLQKQIRKSDMEMDFIQLQMEEKRLNLKKAILDIELLEHQLKAQVQGRVSSYRADKGTLCPPASNH